MSTGAERTCVRRFGPPTGLLYHIIQIESSITHYHDGGGRVWKFGIVVAIVVSPTTTKEFTWA